MSSDQRRDDLLTALALTEFPVHYERVNPELSRRAWQLAAKRHVEYDVDPYDADAELGLDNEGSTEIRLIGAVGEGQYLDSG